MNEVWDDWVSSSHSPPRATVEAKLANPAVLVEIVIIAAVATGGRVNARVGGMTVADVRAAG